MSDQFGLVRLPALEGQAPDPLLDTLLAFLKAAVNADTKAAWRGVNPGRPGGAAESLPIAFTFAHDPDEVALSEKQLPALFAWRTGIPRGERQAADWVTETSNVALLWLPPRATNKARRERQAYRNIFSKALRRNLASGRNPAWQVVGDTDPKTEDYGSLFIKQAKLAQYRLLDVRPFDFDVESPTPGDKTNVSFDGLLATLEVMEIATPLLDDYQPIAHAANRVVLGGEDGIAFVEGTFRVSLGSVTPSSGPLAGGTAITLVGSQFVEDMTVLAGALACTDVDLVGESEATALTPAGAALGAVDVVITRPDGSSATLPNAFTYV